MSDNSEIDAVMRITGPAALGQMVETTAAQFCVLSCMPHPDGGYVAALRLDALYATDIEGRRLQP